MILINLINESLTTEIKEYAKSLFFDTRISQPIGDHILEEPPGFFDAVAVFKKYHDMLPKSLKHERPELHTLALHLEDTDDDIERIAIWASEYLSQ